jgi:hypothetical protein
VLGNVTTCYLTSLCIYSNGCFALKRSRIAQYGLMAPIYIWPSAHCLAHTARRYASRNLHAPILRVTRNRRSDHTLTCITKHKNDHDKTDRSPFDLSFCLSRAFSRTLLVLARSLPTFRPCDFFLLPVLAILSLEEGFVGATECRLRTPRVTSTCQQYAKGAGLIGEQLIGEQLLSHHTVPVMQYSQITIQSV